MTIRPSNATSHREPNGRSRYLAAAVSAILTLAAASAHADPHNGVVTSGSATISNPSANLTQIDQASRSASIDWQSFDVGAQERVIFNQPSASSVALNRIHGQDPSQIYGSIAANGRVFLINPNGIIFGASARINVGSLVASSLDLTDADAESGHYAFSASGRSGAILNNGQIFAADGGSVTLLGGSVLNNGLIVANYGSVNLGAGRSATLDFTGDGLVRFQVDGSLLADESGAGAAVDNAGEIIADGGQVLLTARQANDVIARAVNNDGVIRASRIDNSGGRIRLVGPEGSVVSSGTLDASGVGAASSGGEVQVLGSTVTLAGTSLIDASGSAGGGTVQVGGSFGGADASVLNSRRTDVKAGAILRADSLSSGDAGQVVVWSDGTTVFNGGIYARALGTSGNGGQAEVSGREYLGIEGHAWLRSNYGSAGTLLLDPGSITIVDGNGSAPAGQLNTINDRWLNDELDDASVAIRTSSSNDNAAQTLTVDGAANINWANANTLTLEGVASLTLDTGSRITSTLGGSLVLQSGGAVAIGGRITLAGDLAVTAGDDITQSAPISVAGASSFTTAAGKSVLLGDSGNSFAGTIDIGGGTLLNVTLRDSTSIALQALTLSGDLTVEAGAGNISQAGALDVSGNSSFTVAGGSSVLLGTFANRFNGTLSIASSGGGNLQNVSIQDIGALDLPGMDLTGNLTANGFTLSQSNALVVQGNSSFTAASGQSISLGTTGNAFGGSIAIASSGGGNLLNVTLTDGTAVQLQALTIDGNLTLVSQQGISQSGALSVGGFSQFTAGAGQSIALGNTNNLFTGVVTLASGGPGNLQNVTLTDTSALDLQALSIGGNLAITATSLTQSDALSVNGSSSFTANSGQSVLLNNPNNVFIGPLSLAASGGGHLLNVSISNLASLDLQGLSIDGNLTVAANSISQSAGPLTVIGSSSFTAANGQSIVLDRDDNLFNGPVSLAASTGRLQNVTLHDSSALDLQALSIAGNLDVAATVLTPLGALDIDGSASFTAANGQSILLLNPGNVFSGPVSFAASSGTLQDVSLVNGGDVDLQGLTLAGNLSVTAIGSDMTQSGALSVAGNSTFNAGNGRSIVLSNAGNIFTGAVSVAASSGNLLNVNLRDTTALQLQGLTITGDLTARSGVALTQSGGLVIGGNSVFTAASGQSIVLGDAANSFAGTVTFAAGGAGNLLNVTIRDGSALDLRALSIDGALSATSGGVLTQSAALNVAGVASFRTLNDVGAGITLAGTNAFGSVQAAVRNAADTADAAANIVIHENNATSLGNMSTAAGQSISVTSTGAITALASTTLRAGSVSLDAGGDIGTTGTAVSVTAPNGSISAVSTGNVRLAHTGGAGTTVALTQVVAGNAGDIDVVSDSNLRVADVRAGGSVTLTSTTGSILDDNLNGAGSRIVADDLTLNAAGAVGEAQGVGSGLLDLQVASITATAQGGGIHIDQSQGDLNIRQLSAAGPVTVQAGMGSILDDTSDASAASITTTVGGIELTALNNIGSVTDLPTRAGSPILINTNGGAIKAQVASANGQVNLAIAGGSSLTADPGTISAGGAGRLLIQSTGDLTLSTFQSAVTGFSEVGFSSEATLRLPDAAGPLIAGPVTTVLVRGATDVVRTGRVFDLAADHLVFQSGGLGGDATLNTSVGLLDASIGNGASLSVVQGAGALTLGTISAGNNVSIRAGSIVDDGDVSGITRISAPNLISLHADGNIGAADGAGGGRIDTVSQSVSLQADAGSAVLSHLGDLQLSGAATGGSIDVAAATGSITVNSTLRATGPLTLVAGTNGGATGNISLSGTAQSDDAVVLTALGGGAITDADDVTTHLVAKDAVLSASLIGSFANGLSINAATLNATAPTGVYVNTPAAVQLRSIAGADIVIAAAGNITDDGDAQTRITGTSAALSGASIGAAGAGNEIDTSVGHLSASATNGGINIGQAGNVELGTVSAAGAGNDIVIAATGAITDDGNSGTRISGGNLFLSATSIGGPAAGSEMETQVASLNANATAGGIYILEADDLRVNTVTAAGNDIVLSAGGALTDDGDDTTKVTGAGVSLIAASVGAADNRIDTAATTLSINASNGGVYVDEVDSVTLADVRSAGVGNTVNLRTANNGNMIVQTLVTQGGAVNLTAGGTGSLNVTGTLESNNGIVNLTSGDALAVPGLNTGSGSAVLHTVNDVNVGTIVASQISITSDTGDVILGTANAGTGTIAITANNGTITDNTAISLTAGQATLTARSIGSADNPLNLSVSSLAANASAGGVFIADAVSLTVTGISAAGAVNLTTTGAFLQTGSITSGGNAISVLGRSIDMDALAITDSNGADIAYVANGADANIAVLDAASGRVLVIAADSVFNALGSSTVDNLLGSIVEIRAGGLTAGSGQIGVTGSPLSIATPAGVGQTLFLVVPAANGIQRTTPNVNFTGSLLLKGYTGAGGSLLFDPTTAFSAETILLGGESIVPLLNGRVAVNTDSLSAAKQALSSGVVSRVNIDWAAFDPNVSLFGTLDPALRLPSDQVDDVAQ